MTATKIRPPRLRPDRREALGLASILVLLGLLVLAISGAYKVLFASPHFTVKAMFADTARLRTGDPVRIDGVDIGQIEGIENARGARQAVVTMQLENSAHTLYADASAAIKWRTLLGGAFVVDLARGTPASGPLGQRTIPANRTSTQVELDQLISFDRGAAKTGLQTMPGEFARALRDPLPPGRLLGTLSDVSPAVATGVGALRGAVPDQDLRTLVSATARTVQALDTPTNETEALIAGAAATLQTTAARQGDLRTAIAEAPGVMQRTDTTLAALDTTLQLADPLITRLRAPARQLAPTLRELRPTLLDADQLLQRARPLTASLRPALSRLASASRAGLPLLTALAPGLTRLDTTILPFMGKTDPETKHSAAEMIGPAFSSIGPAPTGHFDRNGHFLRFPAASGPNSVQTAPCQLFLTNPDQGKLAACESLEQALTELLSYNAVAPAPGTTPPPPGSKRR